MPSPGSRSISAATRYRGALVGHVCCGMPVRDLFRPVTDECSDPEHDIRFHGSLWPRRGTRLAPFEAREYSTRWTIPERSHDYAPLSDSVCVHT